MEQKITSAATSINTLNKIYKDLVKLHPNKATILDYGCGKYNTNRDFAESHDFIWFGYDPYNRSDDENNTTMEIMNDFYPDIIILSNVLNVVDDDTLEEIVSKIESLSNKDTDVYITIFERNKSGKHEITTKGYQRNEKVKDYLKWLPHFKCEIKGNIIHAKKEVA